MNKLNRAFDELLTDPDFVEEVYLELEEVAMSQDCVTGLMWGIDVSEYAEMVQKEPIRRKDKPRQGDWV